MNITQAQEKIAEIIKELEAAQDCVVNSISSESIEITTMMDDRPQYKMQVVIEVQMPPGRHW